MSHFETPTYYEGLCDFEYDDFLMEIENMQYLPWIGANFFYQNPRILIIGESIYNYNLNISDKSRETEILRRLNHKYQARAIVKEHGLNFLCGEHGVSDKKNSPVKNFGKIFYNKKNLAIYEKLTLWKKVAFHEFIQKPLKDRNDRQIINYENVQNGFYVIMELIKVLKPHYIIFSGVSCLRYLNDNPEIIIEEVEAKGKVKPREGVILVNGDSFPYIALKHLSYFSYSFRTIINENFQKNYSKNFF